MIMIENDIKNNFYFITYDLCVSLELIVLCSIIWFCWFFFFEYEENDLRQCTSQQNPSLCDSIDINLIEKSAWIRIIAKCDPRFKRNSGYVYGVLIILLLCHSWQNNILSIKKIYWHRWQFKWVVVNVLNFVLYCSGRPHENWPKVKSFTSNLLTSKELPRDILTS